MNLKEIKTDELVSEILKSESEYLKMNFDHSVTGLKNPMTLRKLRRDIARMKTELRGREISNMTQEEVGKRSKIRTRRRLN